jgi:hypothetical protein
MTALPLIKRPLLPRLFLAAALGYACMTAAYADNAVERARQNGALIVGMNYVVPP